MPLPYGYLRVAAAAPVVHLADPEANAESLVRWAEAAAEREADLVLFPELCLTGYTCADLFHQTALLEAAESALGRFLEATAGAAQVFVLGLPVRNAGRVYNAAAVVQRGRVLAVVPKAYPPGYNEFYGPRWFAAGAAAGAPEEAVLAGRSVPFGTDLVFQAAEIPEVAFGVEVCEDLWAPAPPSTRLALAGALVLLNPSASDEQVGKAEYRRALVRQQSARCLAGYVYASSGFGESTTDLVFGGHRLVAENGVILRESARFETAPGLLAADLDTGLLLHERRHNTTFCANAAAERPAWRRVPFHIEARSAPRTPLEREVCRHPFVPADPSRRRERCEEIFAIQKTGLASRLRHVGARRAVIGVSGGLDSTLALLVTVEAFHTLGLDLSGIHALTMPGFGTTRRTRNNVGLLCERLDIQLEEIDIRESCRRHFHDLQHDGRTPDIVFENTQARERTQILMDKANMVRGLVIGTGDLSELALGWCTYNGDHMSMYAVNAGVPKTLVRYLIEYVADERVPPEAAEVLRDILDTPISPELLPPDADGTIAQKTENVVGPYELHDFFLYHFVRRGAPPEKILFLAETAFQGAYAPGEIRKWLRVFLKRFFAQQFKRSCLPDGPKVGSVALSPRGDWRMPSDANVAAWLARLPGE